MIALYPLKFQPIFKEKLWGGNKIQTVLNKDISPLKNCGESWELSAVEGNVSMIRDGLLQDTSLSDLIDDYKEALVGKKVYQKYGTDFPLLIKFIDANQDLSIQVHPNDDLARSRHGSLGKTEMWYILEADPNAQLITGFKRQLDRETYKKCFQEKRLEEILNVEKALKDDVFFIPAGRIHNIGKGILLAEIQQTSDITYRIYDFDRKDEKGNKRELHFQQAEDALNFNYYDNYKYRVDDIVNSTVTLVKSKYFITNRINCTKPFTSNYQKIDSFVIYICIEGSGQILSNHNRLDIGFGEVILIPAMFSEINIIPDSSLKLLEIYVD